MKPVTKIGAAAIAALIVLVSILTLPATPGSSAQGDPIEVVATVGMIGDAVRNVGGDRVDVKTLMGPGIDPHLYKPTAGDARSFEGADIIFYGGLHLEGRMIDVLEKVARVKPVVAVTEAIPEDRLRTPPEFDGQHDPHVWFDVTLWMIVVDTIATELGNHWPDDAAYFRANADAYLAELQALDSWIRTEVDRIPDDQRVLVTAHDAFGYFGDQYGFEVHGIQGVSTASEASASDIQELTDLIVERQIRAMFVESSVPPATIEAVQAAARARGWEVGIGAHLFSDAMGEEGTFEGTYIGMVTWNVNAIVSALAGDAVATPAA